MNDYKELIDILNDVDFADCSEHCFLPCSGSGNCFVLKTADVIEQLVKEYNELDKVHDEMFLELCKVKKERDAAVEDLAILRHCMSCKHEKDCFGLTCNPDPNCGFTAENWEWRGVTE